ncbi:Prefoldin beta-like protein [Filobasidium floriforme]|uniref:Prefoldin beta-like protein n=1 Tax=Filobasidium floriforme TaxID=5210 RepID=UPI001E8DC0D4|nr:Prefoldin beta-like protein [Filobasidium floriforme]KAH8083596.1 Prefoldin beta-like protein [Filobasidium floriforme]
MAAAPQAYQVATQEFQKLQQQMEATIAARQKLDYQQSESESVLKELKVLKPHNTVYKLIGPGLMPQDPEEAKTTVEKRLEFIKKEIDRIEGQLKEIGENAEKKRSEVRLNP